MSDEKAYPVVSESNLKATKASASAVDNPTDATPPDDQHLVQDVGDQQVRPPRLLHPLLYIASTLIVLIVFVVTIFPEFIGASKFLYNTVSLTVIYATLSLAVAMITFGVIGDSGALVKFNKSNGTLIQVSGSSAGFVVFYFLLSSGLSPYKSLEVYLYKNQDRLMRPSDGAIEVTLASRISQIVETTKGQAHFTVPRSENNVRIFVNSVSGQLWELHSLAPKECIEEGNQISISCDSINAYLTKSKACLSDIRLSSHEVSPITTTLETLLRSLQNDLSNYSSDLGVKLDFSNPLLEQRIHQSKFKLYRRNENARSVCEHLVTIENEFNWSRNKKVVKTFLGCNTIYVSLVSETVKEGYQRCL